MTMLYDIKLHIELKKSTFQAPAAGARQILHFAMRWDHCLAVSASLGPAALIIAQEPAMRRDPK